MSFGKAFLDRSSGLHGSVERGGCAILGGVGGVDPGSPAPPPDCCGGVPPCGKLPPPVPGGGAPPDPVPPPDPVLLLTDIHLADSIDWRCHSLDVGDLPVGLLLLLLLV